MIETLLGQRVNAIRSYAGSLIAIPREENYVERRTDGYLEPEMVFIVGTAHISKQSAEEVARVIEAIRPENVVVELCKSRSSVMYAQPDDVEDGVGRKKSVYGNLELSGEDFLDTFKRTIQLGGRSALALRIVLSSVASKISENLGVESGVEFKAARRAAEKVGAQIVLGDRPIEVTLRRAWKSLSLSSKVSLVIELISSLREQNKWNSETALDMLEQIRGDDDAVNALLSYLGERYPLAMTPLVHERDLFIAWSLKRSKAVNGTKNVVGVIGRGHMRGVCYAMTHDSGGLRFRDLAGSRKKFSASQAFARFAIESGIFAALWWSWTQLQ